MEGVRQYLLTVLTAALICSIIVHVSGKQQFNGKIMKLITSVFLSLCVVAPLLKLEVQNISDYIDTTGLGADSIVSDAKDAAINETVAIITERTQTYIMDKAALYGADIRATVSISNPESLMPDSVVIEGSISPYGKTALKKIIIDDLGIPEEKQIWK